MGEEWVAVAIRKVIPLFAVRGNNIPAPVADFQVNPPTQPPRGLESNLRTPTAQEGGSVAPDGDADSDGLGLLEVSCPAFPGFADCLLLQHLSSAFFTQI